MFAKRKKPGLSSRNGAALIVVLSALVLITIIIVVFFAQAMMSRQIAASSASLFKAKNIAIMGMETIVGDLQAEMVAGSLSSTIDDILVLRPSTNATQVPSRVGTNLHANLVKMSKRDFNAWSGPGFLAAPSSPVRAVAANTSESSANARYIEATRWNAPYLMGTNLPSGFTPPDWILTTRTGATTNASALPALSVLADASPANPDYVIGRFAYIIYNQGGLLDINVAGAPSTVSVDFLARRGLPAQIDLGALPGIKDADALIAWRNAATAASGASYETHVFGNTNGFTRVASGDQAFIGRQDLIKFTKDNPTVIDGEALAHLSTFTRALNTPSLTPSPSRPRVTGGYPAQNQDDAYNPSLVNTRVTVPFVRASDGMLAVQGEPFLKYRFPLSRLELFNEPVSPAAAESIKTFFGLERSSTNEPWIYRNGATQVKKLADVASEGREPDFVELLQAGLHVGSLGKGASSRSANLFSFDSDIGNHVVQIFANIMDQYDGDSWPTRISFNGHEFTGIEDLPYLSRVLMTGYRFHSDPDPTKHGRLGLWLQPEVWNPHTPATPGVGPTKFRFIVSGACSVKALAMGPVTNTYNPAGDVSSVEMTFPQTSGIEFSTSGTQDFRSPGIPSPATGATATGDDSVNDAGNTFVGICVGIVDAPDKSIDPAVPYAYEWIALMCFPSSLDMNLQYQSNSGDWVTFSAMRKITNRKGGAAHDVTSAFRQHDPSAYFVHSDPRTDRFGGILSVDLLALQSPFNPNPTIRPDAGRGEIQQTDVHIGWVFSAPNTKDSASFGLLSENKPSSTTRYSDPDGIVRPGEGAYTTGVVSDGGYPLAMDSFSSQNSRPIVLNRPFRSVAELGYVSRAMPWKNLDFFSKDSGDAALLDLFSVNEHGETPLTAGLVDLNTRSIPVLKALFSGVAKSELNPADTISETEAENLAGLLVDLTSGSEGPFLNRSDLVTRFLASPAFALTPVSDSVIKRSRESAVRALTDATDTRTWNLLIDIIAQSGRYPARASSLSQFLVEGEQRYWLHIAIDRSSGEVISRFFEPVYE